MAESKTESTTEKRDIRPFFYFPEANDGKGGSVRAVDQEAADKLAKAGKFINPAEAPAAGEDEAK